MRNLLILSLFLLTFVISTVTFAEQDAKKENLAEYSLFLLRNCPHLMPTIFANSSNLRLTKEQQDALLEIVSEVKTPFFERAEMAMKLEKEIAEEIFLNGKSMEKIIDKIESLILLKKEISSIHFGVINRIRKILTDEQYENVLRLVNFKRRTEKN